MKKTYVLLLLLMCSVSFAQQTIRGLVKDAVSGEPVFSASVAAKHSSIGTIVNEEGNFQLTIPSATDIMLTCIGYKTIAVPSKDFGSEVKIILLERDEQMLEEVIVSNVPLNELLQDVLNTSSARFNKPIVMSAYYREFVKLNGKYTKFSDGLLDYHINGKANNTKSDLIVKQSRAVQVSSEEDAENEGDELDMNSLLNVRKGISNNYDFTFVTATLLRSKAYKKYDFNLKSRTDANGKKLYALAFTPKTDVEESLYEGSITFDPETKLVYEVDMMLAPSHMKYIKTINLLIIKLQILDSKLKVSYKSVGNNYVMSHNNRSAKVKLWNKKRYDEILESRSDLLVTEFHPDDLKYNKKEVYKEKNLYSKGSNFTEKFWLKNNSIVLTADEEQIIRNLEKENVTP